MNAIAINDLSFSYNRKKILQHLNMNIPQGSVFGLLGKNGAGKTTLFKILSGLFPNQYENIRYFGNSLKNNRLTIFQNMGVMIEKPSLYRHFTCEEQLLYLNIIFQQPKIRIQEILQIVGLEQEKNTRIKHCSTGMLQRLYIGTAIFHNPEILILDEPFNGLDPQGIYDLRNLLLSLNKEGKTILISSHIIDEIEKICTDVAILEDGNLLYPQNFNYTNLETLYLTLTSKNQPYGQ
jgi:ABC-2 type transport system ATP-binding protein